MFHGTSKQKMAMPSSTLTLEITQPARRLSNVYFREHPRIRAWEQDEHNVDPLICPRRFFELELLEPEHAAVLDAVVRNGGLVNSGLLAWWIAQNFAQYGEPNE